MFSNFSFSNNEKKYTQLEYVNLWKEIAIQQMNAYKIPASITLAQAILESGNGNSLLALEANNHFGLKCSNWNGETFHKNDDKDAECFRKYKQAKDSYEDHSIFLKSRKTYSNLFTLELKDYKSWANGLKEAGYASNPKYPQLLISLIEKLELYELDKSYLDYEKHNFFKTDITEQNRKKNMILNTHKVQFHKNKIKYIVAKKGDTYYRISKEFGLGMWQLYKYNDFGEKKDYLIVGDIIYLDPKKRKSKSNKIFEVKEEMNLIAISQLEGIKVKQLKKMNNLHSEETILPKGTKINLK
jgi:LysM repeat protein